MRHEPGDLLAAVAHSPTVLRAFELEVIQRLVEENVVPQNFGVSTIQNESMAR